MRDNMAGCVIVGMALAVALATIAARVLVVWLLLRAAR